jgi:hypothetical protein
MLAGVTKHVGDALLPEYSQYSKRVISIGIAPWGVIGNNHQLCGHNHDVLYHSMPSLRYYPEMYYSNILPNTCKRSERCKLSSGKPGRNLILTMNVKIVEISAVAQLIFSFSPWISVFKPHSSICGTCGRWSGIEALVQTMLKFHFTGIHLDTFTVLKPILLSLFDQ